MGIKHAMTSDSSKQELARTKSEIEEILRRVDSLPVLDPRRRTKSLVTTSTVFRNPKAAIHVKARAAACYSSSTFTSPRSALAFSIIFSCSCPGTTS
jgi:hypothetical protein